MNNGYAFTLAACFGVILVLGFCAAVRMVCEFISAIGHHSREELMEDGHVEEASKPYPTSFDDESWGKE